MDKVKYTTRPLQWIREKAARKQNAIQSKHVCSNNVFFYIKCATHSQVNQLLMQSAQTHVLITSLTRQRIQPNKTKKQRLSDLFPQVCVKRPPRSATHCSDGSGTTFNSSESLILNTPPSSSSAASQPCHLIWMPLRFFSFLCNIRQRLRWRTGIRAAISLKEKLSAIFSFHFHEVTEVLVGLTAPSLVYIQTISRLQLWCNCV